MSNTFRIDTRSGRANLTPRREPYFTKIRAGLFVGYRKPETGDGSWIGRYRDPVNGKQVFRALGALVGGDRENEFELAKRLVNEWAESLDRGIARKAITVAQACQNYVAHLRVTKGDRPARFAENRYALLVYHHPIGKAALDRLTPTMVKQWRDQRIKVGEAFTPDDTRRSKATANRDMTRLKAALSHAFRMHAVASDQAWRVVDRLPDADGRRDLFLTPAQCTALIQACDEGYRPFAQALLLTGMRVGELAALVVGDIDVVRGLVNVRISKTKSRAVTLSTAALKVFEIQCRNKLPNAPVFCRGDGTRWRDSNDWRAPFKAAAAKAGLPPHVVPYHLRHAAISNMIGAGVDMLLVARQVGTSILMIDKTYGHLRHEDTRARLDRAAMAA